MENYASVTPREIIHASKGFIMRIITIKQPWAHLIVAGTKNIENRNWPTNYRGPVLVHAGVALNRLDCIDEGSIRTNSIAEASLESRKSWIASRRIRVSGSWANMALSYANGEERVLFRGRAH
jgi:hypothetical protein